MLTSFTSGLRSSPRHGRRTGSPAGGSSLGSDDDYDFIIPDGADPVAFNARRAELDLFLSQFSEDTQGLISVVEETYETFDMERPSVMGVDGKNALLFSPPRYQHIRRFHAVLPTSSGKFVVFQDLSKPHYSVNKSTARKLFLQECPETPISYYSYDEDTGHTTAFLEFVNVWHHPSGTPHPPGTRPLSDFSLCKQLVHNLLRAGRGDAVRGNLYIDIGFTSGQSQNRVKDELGQARSNFLRVSTNADHALLQEAIRAFSVEARARITRQTAPDRYSDDNLSREDEWASKIAEGSFFESYRFGLTPVSHPIGIHCDKQNCRRPGMTHVATFSNILEVDRRLFRLAIIGYSRMAIGNHCAKRALYGPVLKKVVCFVEKYPRELREVSKTLLHAETDPMSTTPPALIGLHLNKLVFYSSFAFMLDMVLVHLGVSSRDNLECELSNGLLNATVFSANPAYFWKLGQDLVGRRLKFPSDDGWRVTKEAAKYFFTLRDDIRGKALPKIGTQRHQPHYNDHVSDKKYKASVQVITKARKHAWEMHDKGDKDWPIRAHHDCTKMLQSKGAGCGPLTAQHVVAIGCLSGLFPLAMALVASIGGTTTTAKKMKKLSPGLADDEWSVHSEEILRSTSTACNLSRTLMEEACCASFKDSKKLANTHDLAGFPGQSIATNDKDTITVLAHGFDSPLPFKVGLYQSVVFADDQSGEQVTTVTPEACVGTLSNSVVVTPERASRGVKRKPTVTTPIPPPPPPSLRPVDPTRFARVSFSLAQYVGWCLFPDGRRVNPALDLECSKLHTRPKEDMVRDETALLMSRSPRFVGKGFFTHSTAFRFFVIDRHTGQCVYSPNNLSVAAPLLNQRPAFLTEDHQYFGDKKTAIEYLFWSVVLDPKYREVLFSRIVPDLLAQSPSQESRGRLLIAKHTNRPAAFLTPQDNGGAEIGLITPGGQPRGSRVSVFPIVPTDASTPVVASSNNKPAVPQKKSVCFSLLKAAPRVTSKSASTRSFGRSNVHPPRSQSKEICDSDSDWEDVSNEGSSTNSD